MCGMLGYFYDVLAPSAASERECFGLLFIEESNLRCASFTTRALLLPSAAQTGVFLKSCVESPPPFLIGYNVV